MTDLYTFGYEGLALDAFIGRLKSAHVKTVIDVRANPLSRKRGFSKNALSTALEAAGISYNHIAAMGCPKTVRDQYKEDGNWSTYTRSFLSHLKQQREALKELAALAEKSTSCLICFEADFDRCHRTFVARRAAELAGFKVKHLTIQKVIPDAASHAAA
jgi:uncharacterized protein (DUF488 family)